MRVNRTRMHLQIAEAINKNWEQLLPEETSDIIMYWEKKNGTFYYNCMTGAGDFDHNKVIRYKTKSLIVKKGYHAGIIHGFFLKEFTSIDGENFVGVIPCTFNISTVPTGIRTWLPKGTQGSSYGCYVIYNNEVLASCSQSVENLSEYIDITSETLLVDIENAYNPDVLYSKQYLYSTYTKRVMREAFGFAAVFDCQYPMLFGQNGAIQRFCEMKQKVLPKNKQQQIERLLSYNLPPLLTKKDEEMVWALMEKMDVVLARGRKPQFSYLFNERKFAVVQKVAEGIGVIRLFYVSVNNEVCKIGSEREIESFEDLQVDEAARTYVESEKIFDCQFRGRWEYMQLGRDISSWSAILLPWDNKSVEGTKLMYFSDVNDQAKQDVENILNLTKMPGVTFPSTDAMITLHGYVESNILETLFSSPYNAYIEYIKGSGRYASVRQLLKLLFGKLDEKQTSLTKAIGLPAFMIRDVNEMANEKVEQLDKNGELETGYFKEYPYEHREVIDILRILSYMKDIFESSPEYLARMNEKLFVSIVKLLQSTKVLPLLNILKNLVTLNGPENIMDYISYIKEVTELSINEATTYLDYIEICSKMSSYITKPRWKFRNAEEIKRAHDDTVEIYNSFSSEIKIRETAEKWNKVSKNFAKYEYSEEQFCIIKPNDVKDIINEGLSLSHCVKTYIDKVVNGQTVIMFVRKTDEPDKPFYTLEIRNKAIRQCHGFANSTIYKEDGLKEFLKRYCVEKDIKFSEGEKALIA